jgi:hypothetical protein
VSPFLLHNTCIVRKPNNNKLVFMTILKNKTFAEIIHNIDIFFFVWLKRHELYVSVMKTKTMAQTMRAIGVSQRSTMRQDVALGGEMAGAGSLDGGGVKGSHGAVVVLHESVSAGGVDISGEGSSQRAAVAAVSMGTVDTVVAIGSVEAIGSGKEILGLSISLPVYKGKNRCKTTQNIYQVNQIIFL